MALFSFILALQIAYMVVGQTADVLMGVRYFDAESEDYDKYPRYRAHVTAVVYSRFAVIAFLALVVALMRCDPVGAEEEVCYIEPCRTRSFCSAHHGLFHTGHRSSCTPSCSTALCSTTLTCPHAVPSKGLSTTISSIRSLRRPKKPSCVLCVCPACCTAPRVPFRPLARVG